MRQKGGGQEEGRKKKEELRRSYWRMVVAVIPGLLERGIWGVESEVVGYSDKRLGPPLRKENLGLRISETLDFINHPLLL